MGQCITICSPTPFVNPGARKSSKENETSSSGLYLSRYGLATKVFRKASLCAAATQCKNFFRKNSNVFPVPGTQNIDRKLIVADTILKKIIIERRIKTIKAK